VIANSKTGLGWRGVLEKLKNSWRCNRLTWWRGQQRPSQSAKRPGQREEDDQRVDALCGQAKVSAEEPGRRVRFTKRVERGGQRWLD